MKIQDILLLKNVNRWNIVNVVREQSVAEHSFNVTMIARAICKEYGIPDDKVIKYALEHDLDEVMFGDIPTPAKKRLNIKNNYFGKHKFECSEDEILIVKMADIMEAVYYISENGAGRHADVVADWNRQALMDKFDELYERSDKGLYNACRRVWEEINDGEFESEKR